MKTKNIILIGPMGAGKSTVGRRLAKTLQTQFYDSDRVIEKKTGVDVATIFEYENECGFRTREEKIIAELCQLENIVLATGGGAILSENTRKILSATGRVFYLKASIDTLCHRTHDDTKRPLLSGSNKQQTITALLQQREPLYQQVADDVINTDHHTANWTVNQILKRLEE